jgi:hypothetical protein
MNIPRRTPRRKKESIQLRELRDSRRISPTDVLRLAGGGKGKNITKVETVGPGRQRDH